MSSDHEQPEYTRRRFSLPESKDDLLVRLAERHYQGNASLFIRAAIEDHRDTLEGTGQSERTLHDIRSRLDAMASTQQDLQESISDMAERAGPGDTSPNATSVSTRHLPQPHQEVFAACVDGQGGCRFVDIVDHTGLPAEDVQAALEALIDTALLTTDTDNRYHPTSTHPTNPRP